MSKVDLENKIGTDFQIQISVKTYKYRELENRIIEA